MSGCTTSPQEILLQAMSLPRTRQSWRRKKSLSVTTSGRGSVRDSLLFPGPSLRSFLLLPPLHPLPFLLPLPLLLLLKWSQEWSANSKTYFKLHEDNVCVVPPPPPPTLCHPARALGLHVYSSRINHHTLTNACRRTPRGTKHGFFSSVLHRVNMLTRQNSSSRKSKSTSG